MNRREFQGRAKKTGKHMGFGRMPHHTTHPTDSMEMVAGSKQAHPQDCVIDLEETLQDLAFRAADGDRRAGEDLLVFHAEQDVEYNNQFDNPTNRSIDPQVQGFPTVCNGFNRN